MEDETDGRTNVSNRTLYTAWLDHGGGTGQDRTVAVLVKYAESEAEIRDLFRARHGFEPEEIKLGLIENTYTDFALSKQVLGEVKLANLLSGQLNIEIEVRVSLTRP